MSLADKFAGLSDRLERERRRAPEMPAAAPPLLQAETSRPGPFGWPQGSVAFDLDALKAALRRGWRLNNLDREPTPAEAKECGEIVALLGSYVDYLPLDLQGEASIYFTYCLGLPPKAKGG